MKRSFFLLSMVGSGVLIILLLYGNSTQNHKFDYVSDIRRLFDQSYEQISDSLLSSWDSLIAAGGLRENPFGMTIFFINLFNKYDNNHPDTVKAYYDLNRIFASTKTNPLSSAVATVAIMQKFGWDIQLFYNKNECYLGLCFSDSWTIRKGNWIEINNKKYYLKEFDNSTPAGVIKYENPASVYQSIESKRQDLKPFPIVRSLPRFNSDGARRKLKWSYKKQDFMFDCSIPEEQIEWTGVLPASLYGMVSSGIEELKNTDIPEQLRRLAEYYSEVDQVNLILKFCQSESIFTYDKNLSIKSISQQLIDAKNDCDGRSVFLYCLLFSVLDYPDNDIVFLSWPNHLAIGLRPKTNAAHALLAKTGASVEDYFVLDATYLGETMWGSKMKKLPDKCAVIAIAEPLR